MNFTHPTQNILERLSKLSKASRILSYVYRFLKLNSFTRKNKFRHDSKVRDREKQQSIDERLDGLLTQPSIKLGAHKIKTTISIIYSPVKH